MIVGLGTDIVEIKRVANVYESTGQAFVERILTSDEILEIPSNELRIPAFLAKRFAAKEAAAKALGTGIAEGVSFMDFCIGHDELGAPSLTISGQAFQLAKDKAITHWHLSLSDEKHYVVATVIVETLKI